MDPLVIGIAGGTGSGKTTIAQAIIERIGPSRVRIIPHDAYYKDAAHLPITARARINFDHPDALDTPLLIRHLDELIAGRDVEIPEYDFSTHTRKKEGRPCQPAPVIIVEGILLYAEPALRERIDIKIYVETDDDIRFIRRLRRDIAERGRTMESVVAQYLETVKPMHELFVLPSRKHADLIIPEGHKPVSTDALISILQQRIGDAGIAP